METTTQSTDDEFSWSPLDWEKWLGSESSSSTVDNFSDNEDP